jgi:hypothetical protein
MRSARLHQTERNLFFRVGFRQRRAVPAREAQLLSSSYRQSTDLTLIPEYGRLPPDDPAAPDPRFVDLPSIVESIVTSSGQNDAGLFELALRDERYLPFEGTGAISHWRLELGTEFKTFDHASISDVILHLRYTARDGGETLRGAAVGAVASLLGDAAKAPLARLFSLRHEFPAEWRRLMNAPAAATNTITVDLATTRFPYVAQGRTITIQRASTTVISTAAVAPQSAIAPGVAPVEPPIGGDWGARQARERGRSRRTPPRHRSARSSSCSSIL